MADTIWNGGAAALHCKIMTYFYYFIFSLSILIYKIYKTFLLYKCFVFAGLFATFGTSSNTEFRSNTCMN